MDIMVNRKYLNLVSGYLKGFKWTDSNTANFRCPFCGDSERSETKARGYVYTKGGEMFFRCHNCDHGTTIQNLIKHLDSNLHNQYVMERYGVKKRTEKNPEKAYTKVKKTTISWTSMITHCKDPNGRMVNVNNLDEEHHVRDWLAGRQIPLDQGPIYFCQNIKAYADQMRGYAGRIKRPEARVCFPFVDRNDRLVGFTARSLVKKSNLRYLTLRFNSDQPLIYNLNHMNPSIHVYVTEGPIDSLFLPNAIAVSGSDFGKAARFLVPGNTTLILDNEPRNRQIARRYRQLLDMDFRLFIWPRTIREKDINDWVLSGVSPEEIKVTIDQNVFGGLEGKARLGFWTK